MENKKTKQKLFQKSFISIATLMIATTLLLLAIYFLNFVLSEIRIVESHTKAVQAYYLAEGGVNEAIWKLKYDHQGESEDGDKAWADDFITKPTCETFSDSFTRNTDNIYSGSYYVVTIQNLSCAWGEITVNAYINLPNGSKTQRIVKIKVFKAQNPSPTRDSAVFTGGASEDITFSAGVMNVYKGNLFTNNNLILQLVSTLNVYDNPETPQTEGKVLVVRNINKSPFSTINATAKCSKNMCQGPCELCPPDSISMPMVDFDSNSPTSYKSKAQAAGTLYTASQFEEMLWNNPNLTLNNEVTYVTGPIELKGGRNLTVNGVLVADGNITVGEDYCWVRGIRISCGLSKITVNHISGRASGVLTKGKVSFDVYTSQVNINGLLYANDWLKLISLPESFNIIGGIVARKMHFISLWESLNITLNNDLIEEAIGNPGYSPVVQIDHWEETY